MSAIPIPKMTLEEYLEFDFNAEGRFEYFDGEVFELSGGSPEHALLSMRIGHLLSRELPKSCLIYSSDLHLKVPKLPPYRYADATALCGQPIYEEVGKLRCLINPVLIVEILSSSTEAFDRGDKFEGYKSIPSFTEYLLVAQDKKSITHFVKHNERFWLQTKYDAGETFKIVSLGCELSVDEIYEGIILEGENLE
jgi:Uma2 family endonuclease